MAAEKKEKPQEIKILEVRNKRTSIFIHYELGKTLKRNKRVLNISTPILAMYPDEENKGADHMSEDEASAVEKVVKEAKKYISGDREQGQIEFSDPDADKKGKKGDDNTAEFPAMAEASQN